MKDFAATTAEAFRKQAEPIARNLLAAVAAVGSVATLALMLASKGFRQWVNANAYVVFCALVVAVAVILVLINALMAAGRKYQTITLERSAGPQATARDTRAADAILAIVPPGGELVAWLEGPFEPATVPAGLVETLRTAHRRLLGDPVHFDDALAAARFRDFQGAARTLLEQLERGTYLEAGSPQRIVPVEWDRDKYRKTVAAIQEARDTVVHAYDDLRHVCADLGLRA